MFKYPKSLKVNLFVFLMDENNNANVCPKCKGSKRIVDANGTVRPCWDCLLNGEMDQHSKAPKDSGIVV